MLSAKPRYRVGVIGCGRKGTGHARGYATHPLCEVVAGADTDPENLAIFGERFNITALYSDYNEMLAKEKIDIAAPILPVSANPSAVIAAAKAGVKAIYCEKPLCASLEEGDRMVEVCRSRGIPFASGDAYRNFHQLWEAKAMIEAGRIGEVHSMNLYQSTNEISGGGCQGLSVMRLFAKDAEVEWVTGWTTQDPFSDNDQGMGGYVRFNNGMECFVHVQPAVKKGIEVIGTKGMFFSDWYSFHMWDIKDWAALETVKFDQITEIEGLFPEPGIGETGYEDTGWRRVGNRQKDGIQSIVDSLEKGTEPRCSGKDMLKALEIAIALRESHRRGHAPVKLPIEDRSQKIMPHPGRWGYKKDLYGKEWYAQQLANQKRQ